MQRVFTSLFSTLSLAILSVLVPLKAEAQVTTDGTTATTVSQDGNNYTVEQGDRVGDNLFHSFDQFSVPTGGSAGFNNAADVANIFSRVTGTNISNIDGLLSANGAANLYLINPNGIIFGENARLDLGGSFFASTADSLLFEGDTEFSASNPQAPPLLEVSIPVGASFRNNPGDIINRSVVEDSTEETVGLEVSPGQKFTLLGGDISFDGGNLTARGGNVELGGSSQAGVVNISEDENLVFPENLARSNISLINNATVDITAEGGGQITVNADNLELTEESSLLADIGEGLGSENAVAGTINVNATRIFADNNSEIRSNNLGVGQAGKINITSSTLNLVNSSAIASSNSGQGNAGDIFLNVRDSISLDQGGSILARVTEGRGDSGQINIEAGSVNLTNNGSVISSNSGQGNAGNISIEVRDNIFLNQEGLILAQVAVGTEGNAGNINITAGSLEATGNSFILADTRGIGDAGDIDIDVNGSVSLDGSLILTELGEEGEGNAGDINIAADSLTVANLADITTQTEGQGDGGNITLSTDNDISLEDNGEIRSLVETTANGNAGNIVLTAKELNLDRQSRILSETNGNGNAGNISIIAPDGVSLNDEAEIRSSVEANANGNGGSISITTNEVISLANDAEIRSLVVTDANGNGGDISLIGKDLNFANSSQIIADNSGLSLGENNVNTAGDIIIDVNGDINLNDSNKIQSQVRGENAVGNAGNIDINAGGSLLSQDGNLILADSQATGDGGSISITVGEQILLEGTSEGGFPSQIVAGLSRENSAGTGGTIEIDADRLVLDDLAFITSNNVSDSIGAAGNVTINADSLRLSNNSFINALTANDSDGGSISINARTLNLASGGKITAATDGAGNAGNINLDISDQIKLDNSIKSSAEFLDFGEGSQLLNVLQNEPSGIYANTTSNSAGRGGNVNIGSISDQILQNFTIANNAQIVANSSGGGSGGNITIRSQSFELDSNATVSASTASGQGGGVTLQVADDIILRNNSLISADAGRNANGGNVTIDVGEGFILAFPNGNNDIIANAEQGNGGRISIDTQAIFGLEERSSTPPNQTNDIDASSEFGLQGDFSLNTPDFDPTSGLIELPASVADASDQISQNPCQQGVGSEFIVTGKGGLPPSPTDSLNSGGVEVGLVEPLLRQGEGEKRRLGDEATDKPEEDTVIEAVPAMGWVFNEEGEVTLTAHSNTDTEVERSLTKRSNSCSQP